MEEEIKEIIKISSIDIPEYGNESELEGVVEDE